LEKKMKNWLAFLILVSLLVSAVPVNAQSTGSLALIAKRQPAILIDNEGFPIGTAEYWNIREFYMLNLALSDGWRIKEAQIYVGIEVPPLKKDKPVPGEFPCVRELPEMPETTLIQCSLQDDFSFSWGQNRTRYVAFHADLVKLDGAGSVAATNEFWALPVNDLGQLQAYYPWPGLKHGGYFNTVFTHPQRGHFIDSPVSGLSYETDTNWGITDESGGFDFFPGERVKLWAGSVYLGNPIADQKVSPLDIFESADLSDNRVINMARLLQSLDADGDPKAGININSSATACLNNAVADLNLEFVDFGDDVQVDDLINQTMARCEESPDVQLVKVSAEDAVANLDRSTNSNMFRKNVSRTPNQISTKSKLDIMTRWFPALKADGTPVTIEYNDENGNLIRTATDAKPIVVTYTDSVPETGMEDIFAAISRDDGKTFKRMNLSRAADKSSFELANGQPYFGDAKKPVVQVKSNNILVAWTSKYCRSGKPAYAIDTADEYAFDDPYYKEDIWGVGGPQRSVDYTEQGFPEVGEIPYSCVWTARGTIVTQEMLNTGGFWSNYTLGDIVWFKPERLTSGRRDANQIFAGGADNAGFAIAWQEDPEGLLPGEAVGPGEGWSGATVNHKTDIWYSFIPMTNFNKVDENFVSGGEPLHEDPDIIGRPKALVPMSLPVRLTDNDVVNTDNMMVELDENGYPVVDEFGNWIPIPNTNADPESNGDGTGTHAYGYKVSGLCVDFYEYNNQQGAPKKVCRTADGRLLDGDTGSSRANLNLQTYKKADGSFSAWAILAYEESKGMGGGEPEANHIEDGVAPDGRPYKPDEGKNVVYHSFDFQNPETVSAGTIINLPETNAAGNPVYLVDESGNLILDWQGQPQPAYENARRPRFVLQGKSGMGSSRTVMVILYKEGAEGHGRPSDIMVRRLVVPSTDKSTDNPYRVSNIMAGAQNVSTVTPTEVTASSGDPQSDDPWGAVKVVRWQQSPGNLAQRSSANPWEDARAHRGDLNGDFLVVGYTYTPNWGASRNGNDKYDFYVRRSYDGGVTWTTDPKGVGVTHCDTFTDPLTKIKEEVCNTYGPGEFEQARNVSQLKNNKTTVIEPRIVAPPGTIKNPDGTPTGKPEDINNPYVYYLSYGTATNPDIHNTPLDDEDEEGIGVPLDLYYSFTLNLGESYEEVAWHVNPDSLGNYAGETVYRWPSLAYGDAYQGEAQLRMTPDGSRFYATWLEEGSEGSDIQFRRIMSPMFPSNVVVAP
jgi:hypothetical protein